MELYYAPYSPPTRAVRLTAEYIGVSFDLKFVDVVKGEQMTPDYEELNPQRRIPFLVDGDLKLGESRAIMIYLVEKYAKNSNSKILPSDPVGRAQVNWALNFDVGTLYKSVFQYYFPVAFKIEDTYYPDRYENLKRAFGSLDSMLDNQDYVAGRNLTIADISIITTVTTAEMFGFEVQKYKNVVKWCNKVKVLLPGYNEINEEGIEILKKVLDEIAAN